MQQKKKNIKFGKHCSSFPQNHHRSQHKAKMSLFFFILEGEEQTKTTAEVGADDYFHPVSKK